jgi:hypothetical protein
MKRVHLLFLIAITASFAACAPSQKYTGVWVNKDKIKGKTYSNIFVIAMTSDAQAQAQIEADLAKTITSRGLKVVKSMDVMPKSLSDPKMPSKEELTGKIKESGCDAVLIASLLKKVDNISYIPSHEGHEVVQGGSYYGFYSYYYNTVSVPGYMTQDKVFVVQSNFFDVATEEKMWSVESDIYQPGSLQKLSDIYVYKLVHQLEDQKVIKKQGD